MKRSGVDGGAVLSPAEGLQTPGSLRSLTDVLQCPIVPVTPAEDHIRAGITHDTYRPLKAATLLII